MKRFCLLFLAGLLFTPFLSAQVDPQKSFEDFQREADAAFQGFKRKAQTDFAKTLASQWESFQVFQGILRPSKPKPGTPPAAPDDLIPETVRVPGVSAPEIPDLDLEPLVDEEITVPEYAPLGDAPLEPVAPARPRFLSPFFDMGGSDPAKGFSFYGLQANMAPPKSLVIRKPTLFDGKGRMIEGESIARFWTDLDADGGFSFKTEVLPSFRQVQKDNGLGDWTLYRLIVRFSEFWWGDVSEQAVVQTWLLNNLGFDARIAKSGERLLVLLPFKQKVYARKYVKLGGECYYIMAEDGLDDLYTYSTPFPGDVKAMDLTLNRPDRIFLADKITTVEKALPTLGLKLSLPIQTSRKQYYLDYPQVDVVFYARELVDPEFTRAMVSQLSQLQEMDRVSAARKLLHSIQHDFDYAVDQDQFGYEKPFFVSENFIYPKNDCEDRSILFAFLVKNILNLDVVLLDYPEHIATAVRFDADVPGAYVEHKGRKYIICDPTYIGADIGMEMPLFLNTQAVILDIS